MYFSTLVRIAVYHAGCFNFIDVIFAVKVLEKIVVFVYEFRVGIANDYFCSCGTYFIYKTGKTNLLVIVKHICIIHF